MFIFRKISRALFSWNTCFEIRPLPYYRRFAAAIKAKYSKTDNQKESGHSSSSSVKDYFTNEALADAEILWELDVIVYK